MLEKVGKCKKHEVNIHLYVHLNIAFKTPYFLVPLTQGVITAYKITESSLIPWSITRE